LAHCSVEMLVCTFEIVKRPMHPTAAPIEVATGFGGKNMVVCSRDEMPHLFPVVHLLATLFERSLRAFVVRAGVADFFQPFLLQERSTPLDKVVPPMMLGIPRAAMHLDLF